MRKILLIAAFLSVPALILAQVSRYAVVDGNNVTNVILAESKYISSLPEKHTAMILATQVASTPGLNGGAFVSTISPSVIVSTP